LGAAGIRTCDLRVKKNALIAPRRLACKYVKRLCVCIAIFIAKVEISTSGYCTICRHYKHSNFYRTVNIRRLILGKCLNFKSPDHAESAQRITKKSRILTWCLFRINKIFTHYPLQYMHHNFEVLSTRIFSVHMSLNAIFSARITYRWFPPGTPVSSTIKRDLFPECPG
jgi:hypothetical protein